LIHPTAVIDPAAELADEVEVGPYSIIGARVRIGPGTRIGPHVVIRGPTRIGADNRIFQFASLGEIPQDKKYKGEDSELVIGDGNTIREYVTINRGTSLDRGRTTVGDRNWIMAYVHIAHDCVVGSDTIFSNGATLAGHVVIEDHVTLGGFTLVHQFCRIGAHAFCGMGTAINRDVPPYVMVAGNPAKPYGLNKEGLRRKGFPDETMRALQRAYRIVLKTGVSSAAEREELEALKQGFPEVARFATFVETSRRGVLRDNG
jgi:UDP-N-acetylglucosamine acyltransferase